jgi:hypothetical protein
MWLMGVAVMSIALFGLLLATGFAVFSSPVLLGILLFAVWLVVGWVWRSVIPEDLI